MRWIALVESPDHVCCRYRLRAFEPALAANGMSLELASLPRSLLGRHRLFASLKGANVILQRRLLDAWSWRVLRRSAAHVAFDFDDAVWLRDSYSERGLISWQRARCFQRTIRESDLVLAGNRFLADAAASQSDDSKVHIIPTAVEASHYPVAEHTGGLLARRASKGVPAPAAPPIDTDGQFVRLVWIGSSSTLQGLEKIAGMLDLLSSRLPNVCLRVVSDRTLQLQQMPVEFWPWSAATEAEALATADIGIAWLPDDDWSRGKCGLKILQYMAAGLPVVCNPVGVQRELIQPRWNGFLAASASEWFEAIAQLAADAAMRRRFGSFGRNLVERSFCVRVVAPQLMQALQSVSRPARTMAASA